MDRNGLVELELFRGPCRRRLKLDNSTPNAWEIWHVDQGDVRAMCKEVPITDPTSTAR